MGENNEKCELEMRWDDVAKKENKDLGRDHKEVPSEDKFGGYKAKVGENNNKE